MLRYTLLVSLCLYLASPVEGQPFAGSYVTRTIAGVFPIGDGGPALSALLETPQAVILDPSGTMYIADSGNGVIRKVTRAGVISTVPGFSGYAYTLGLDSAGTLYIASYSRVYKLTQSGALTSIAGTGASGYSGDGGPATAATFAGIYSLALDSNGNIYLADYFNHRVRKIDAKSGNVTTVAGTNAKGFGGDGGPATNAPLNYPTNLAVDGAGSLYIADSSNYRIRKVGLDGNISTVAGNGICCNSPDGGLATSVYLGVGPIAVDQDGNIYVWDFQISRLRMISSGGVVTTLAGNGKDGYVDGTTTGAQFSGVSGLAVDTLKNVYVVEQNNERVRLVAGGNVSTVAGKAHFAGDSGLAASALLHRPEGAVVGSDGSVYFTDTMNHRVRKIATDGTISTIAGTGDPGFSGDRGPANAAMFAYPDKIAIDSSGNLYVVDQSDLRIRKISTSGTVTTVAGNGNLNYSNDTVGPVNSPFAYIKGIAVDAAGNLYLSELLNYKVKKVNASGGMSTYAGNGIAGFSGDGQTAALAQLSYPTDLAVDSAGNLYVSDNYRVRKIDTSGIITTVAGNGRCCSLANYSGKATATTVDPSGLAADAVGGLWLSDSYGLNYLARDGSIARIAGGYTLGFAGDDSPTANSTGTQFSGASGVALAPAGDVVVADTNNSRIRKLQPNDPVRLDVVSGDQQSGTTGNLLKPFLVKLTGRAGLPAGGVTVTYQVTSGAATLTAQATVTDANGQAGVAATATKAGTITVTATAGNLSAKFTATVTDAVVTPPDAPVIASGGIGQNGFSVPPVQTVSPGAITTIYGSNFAPSGTPASTNSVSNGSLSTSFLGTCVTFGGVAAPIFGLATTQVTVEVPNVSPGQIAVQVVRNCGTGNDQQSNVMNVTAQAASPEFLYFQTNADGHNPVAAISASGDYIGVPGSISGGVTLRPATAGDILVIYALGLGVTTPAQTIGAPAAGIAQTAPATVTIGGVKLAASDVIYAGVSPAFIGLYQINLRVPAGVPAGNQQITVQIGNATSPAGAYLAVQ